jgi:hypothetical protein
MKKSSRFSKMIPTTPVEMMSRAGGRSVAMLVRQRRRRRRCMPFLLLIFGAASNFMSSAVFVFLPSKEILSQQKGFGHFTKMSLSSSFFIVIIALFKRLLLKESFSKSFWAKIPQNIYWCKKMTEERASFFHTHTHTKLQKRFFELPKSAISSCLGTFPFPNI